MFTNGNESLSELALSTKDFAMLTQYRSVCYGEVATTFVRSLEVFRQKKPRDRRSNLQLNAHPLATSSNLPFPT
jgi:hypothetical protein